MKGKPNSGEILGIDLDAPVLKILHSRNIPEVVGPIEISSNHIWFYDG
jgi:hypothetical protein